MRFLKRYILILSSLAFVLACSNPPPNYTGSGQQDDDDPSNSNIVNILFIGNSLTYFNNGVAGDVQGFYDGGNTDVNSDTHEKAHGGFTLRNHLNNQESISLIEDSMWDIIVLQENGVEATQGPEAALESIRDLKDILDSKPATVYLFMTWAYENESQMTDQLVDFYTLANEATDWEVVPVGLGWRDFEAENKTIHLLSDDGVHPSIYGTYFASAMLFRVISRQGLFSNAYDADLLPADAAYLRQYANDALARY